MRVKIFTTMSLYRKPPGLFKKVEAHAGPILEDQINQWLSQNKGVEVVRVEQSGCGGSLSVSLWMISVWYNEHESE